MAQRTLQVHLNRTCNLRCTHCYSMSGPDHREQLPVETLLRLLPAARSHGYDTVSFSGGEPLLYEPLPRVLEACRALGLRTSLITNGTVLRATERRAALALVDFVAVSVDGPEPIHNAIRGPNAYARMVEGLEIIRQLGLPFGIVHAATIASLPHIGWLADFAAAQGAELLQLHPLGLVGAAASGNMEGLDGPTLARLYLTARALEFYYQDRLRIHVDIFNREQLRLDEALVVPPAAPLPSSRLADLINPLVVMSNGDISPICHAMPRPVRLGNIIATELGALTAEYLPKGYQLLRDHCHDLWERAVSEDGWPYFNWYERLETATLDRPAAPRQMQMEAAALP